jgi:site-specific DNA-methyltransferase (adenine-specific)
MTQASFSLQRHNPDVLTCIANLSNDEVFTPPEFANQMLDTLEQAWADSNDGESIWGNKDVTFLDPCTKSGVYLREIVKRLNNGLTEQIPDLTERINHILTKQVFGIGITELTSLIARRSVYCSKYANGIHSVARTFANEDGNIWFERTEHTWSGGKCSSCGASKSEYERAEELETHAYAFIHSSEINLTISSMFGGKVHFDVIIGNPPYQLNDGGGASGMGAIPIYQHFVRQAKNLEPRFLTFVIPARWYAGGRGLDDFREEMLNDRRIRVIEDFPDSSIVFPGTHVKSGVCFFLWNRDNPGDAEITTRRTDGTESTSLRPLREKDSDVFLRYNESISILRKVINFENGPAGKTNSLLLDPENQFSALVKLSNPFGFRSFFRGRPSLTSKTDRVIYQNRGFGYVSDKEITENRELVDTWKIFIGKAYGGDEKYPHSILSRPFIGAPGSICTETYFYIGPFNSEQDARNALSYISTRLFRFLVLMRKPTQNTNRTTYSYVPLQDFTETWSDEKLYEKYSIAKEEVAFIESMIRPMELGNE